MKVRVLTVVRIVVRAVLEVLDLLHLRGTGNGP